MIDLNYQSIPKIIHYCWFGPNKMNRTHRQCIKSWKKYLSDYKFMKWDESNINIKEHPFLKAAYEMKKWAFVADYVRLQKVYKFGGIYLDTDMLLIKPLDQFLPLDTFFGAENLKFISCGIIGARKGDSFINSCLKKYNDIIPKENSWSKITIPQLITSNFRSTYNFEGDFAETVEMPGITVFPPIYFYSLSYKERYLNYKKQNISDNSYAIHLWDESWKNLNEFQLLQKGKYLQSFKKIMVREKKLSKYYVRDILVSFVKSLIR